MKFFAQLILIIATASSLNSCKDQKGNASANHNQTDRKPTEEIKFDSISYEFHDASIAPEHQRNYTWTITPNKIYYKRYSFEDSILLDTSFNINSNKWVQCQQAFYDCKIGKRKATNNNVGCTGGTTVGLQAWLKAKETFSASNYYCGNPPDGDLDGNIEKFLKFIQLDIDPKIYQNIH